jgi:hypothetical protein
MNNNYYCCIDNNSSSTAADRQWSTLHRQLRQRKHINKRQLLHQLGFHSSHLIYLEEPLVVYPHHEQGTMGKELRDKLSHYLTRESMI